MHAHTHTYTHLSTALKGHMTFQKRKEQKHQEQAHHTTNSSGYWYVPSDTTDGNLDLAHMTTYQLVIIFGISQLRIIPIVHAGPHTHMRAVIFTRQLNCGSLNYWICTSFCRLVTYVVHINHGISLLLPLCYDSDKTLLFITTIL